MIDHNFYASPVQASQTLITHILEAMDKELERPFTIALSGGTTPATLFEVWEREYAAYTPWSRIYFYWVDERCVPPGDDQSNFGLAYRLLFSKVGIPASHYYRIVGEGAPEEEAKQYSSIVKTTVPTVDGVPVFDFVLLGIGEDGHTSSIFPDHQELLIAGILIHLQRISIHINRELLLETSSILQYIGNTGQQHVLIERFQ